MQKKGGYGNRFEKRRELLDDTPVNAQVNFAQMARAIIS